MKKITSIIKTTQPYHPALGYTYVIELDNGERFEVTDDEFMGKYCFDETKPMGDQFDLGKAERLGRANWAALIGMEWVD